MRDFAESQQVQAAPQPALILGRHVLPYFGGKSGKHIGEVTKAAYEATTHTAMEVPVELVPTVRELIAKRRAG